MLVPGKAEGIQSFVVSFQKYFPFGQTLPKNLFCYVQNPRATSLTITWPCSKPGGSWSGEGKENRHRWRHPVFRAPVYWLGSTSLFVFIAAQTVLHLVFFLAASFYYLLAVQCMIVTGIPMALILCPNSSSFPLPYGHPDVTICLNHPFCSCLNILIDLMSYVSDL